MPGLKTPRPETNGDAAQDRDWAGGGHSVPSRIIPSSLSKRAARRLIQRALVLVGRDRRLRQHIRETRLVTTWTVEDWGLTWTVELDRGKVCYDRRSAGRPDCTFAWRTAEDFFRQIDRESFPDESFGAPELRRLAEPFCRCFCRMMQRVLSFPFDDEGDRLA